MSFENFLSDSLAAFTGGAALTATLFILNERVFPTPDVNGVWWVQTHTVSSRYNPYCGMYLKHEVMVWQEGKRLYGSSEKIYEDSINGPRQVEGSNRSRGVVDGYLTQFYVPRKNRIRLHIEEAGPNRTSATYFDLVYSGESGTMQGKFAAAAGSTNGDTIWSPNRNDPLFTPRVQWEHSAREGDIGFLDAEARQVKAE